MVLSKIFSDPLDPARSIQLNNKYWPGEKFKLLGPISEAEGLLSEGGPAAALRPLQYLRPRFSGADVFRKFLRRLHRLHLYRSDFGVRQGAVDLTAETISANRYSGDATRAEYPLERASAFASLIHDTERIYRSAYGTDYVRMNSSVRFAVPDERRADVTDYGPLSDYHNDEYKGISTIVYLCEVTSENGPFSYVRGSHLIPRSLVLMAIHQCVAFDMGFDIGRVSVDQMTQVPLEFRGSPGIGNFLDSEKTEVVQRYVETVEGAPGTFVTFNGQYLLHRGGKPVAGSRTAAFLQPEGMFRHKIASFGSLIFSARHT